MLAYVFLFITVRKFIQFIFNLMGEEAEDIHSEPIPAQPFILEVSLLPHLSFFPLVIPH